MTARVQLASATIERGTWQLWLQMWISCRSQDIPNAYMHAMCPEGLSKVACQSIVHWYINSELDKCTWPGLAKAIHAAQDSYAGGHRDVHEYSGLFNMGMIPHFIDDTLP